MYEKLGINNKTLSGYETDGKTPDKDTVKLLADFYEVNPAWILGYTEDPSIVEGSVEYTDITEWLRQVEEGKLLVNGKPVSPTKIEILKAIIRDTMNEK